MPSGVYFLYKKLIYLKVKVRKRDEEKHTEIFHLLVHTPDGASARVEMI